MVQASAFAFQSSPTALWSRAFSFSGVIRDSPGAVGTLTSIPYVFRARMQGTCSRATVMYGFLRLSQCPSVFDCGDAVLSGTVGTGYKSIPQAVHGEREGVRNARAEEHNH